MTSLELTKHLHVQCADVIYRAERLICPVDEHKELSKVGDGLWECPRCHFVRCTKGLRGEQK